LYVFSCPYERCKWEDLDAGSHGIYSLLKKKNKWRDIYLYVSVGMLTTSPSIHKTHTGTGK
jgi:hypothetical protein